MQNLPPGKWEHRAWIHLWIIQKRLTEIAKIFNNSPLAKRNALSWWLFFQINVTSGDHAADQKKSHEILREWKIEVIFQRLEEKILALFNMGATKVVAFFY